MEPNALKTIPNHNEYLLLSADLFIQHKMQ